MTAGQPPPGGQELHRHLLMQAANHMIRHGNGVVRENILASLQFASWPAEPAGLYADQITAEAAAWTPEQLLEAYRAWLESGARQGAEIAIGDQQRRIHAQREALRREDKREEQAAIAAEGPVVIRDGSWLTGQQFGPVEWAVPGLIPEGVTIFGGPPKGGKSWLALSVALSLSAGAQILSALWGGAPRPVLYLALEDSDRRMKDRCAQLGYHQIPPLFEYITSCRPGRAVEEIAAWLERHRGQRPLVIIDTWGKISMPANKGETIYDRDYRLGTQVKDLADGEPGAAVWVNHHLRKQSATDFLDAISGTQGVAGSADTVAVLVRRRGETMGRLHITGRDVEEDTYQLEGFPCWQLAGGGLPGAAVAARAATERENLGERSAQLLDEIVRAGRMTTKEAALLLGISPDAASVYLGRLAKAEKIAKDGRGVWVPFVPPVGSVGSVVSNPNNQQNKQGVRETPPEPDMQKLYELGDPGS